MTFDEAFVRRETLDLKQKDQELYWASGEAVTFTDSKIRRRILHYCTKALALKKELSFNVIDWARSKHDDVRYRSFTIRPSEAGCTITVSQELAGQAKELALISDAEILKFVDDVILITEAEPMEDPGPRVIYVNEAFEKLTGYPHQDIFGKNPRILQGTQTGDEARNKIREGLSAWQPITVDILNYTKDQKEFMVELKITPRFDESGWYTHWVSIQRDITDRYLLESQLRHSMKFASIGEVASGIGHEINNPASIIKGLLEMNDELPSENGVFDERILKNQQRMKIASERILQITAGLRSYARKEQDEPTTFVINEVIKETVDIMAPIFTKEGINIIADLPPVDVPFHGKRIKLQQVLLNLITNAKDACVNAPSGKITVHLEPTPEGSRIHVQDNGHGIPKEIQGRIFDVFFTTKPKSKGTGLGLSLVKTIVAELGGQMTLHSEVNKGATFSIQLPQATLEVSSVPELTHPAHPLLNFPAPLRALVVEDEPDLLEILADKLKRYNFILRLCSNGNAALDELRSTPYDFVISDFTMPGMDGATLYSKMLELGQNPAPKFILITGGNLDYLDKAKTILEKIDGNLAKPFNVEAFEALMRKLYPKLP